MRRCIALFVALSVLAACGPAATPAAPVAESTTPVQPTAVHTLAGGWHGSIGEGAGKLRLVVELTEKEGTYTGILESLDQGAKLPIDAVTVAQQSVKFGIARVGGSYEGTLDATRTKLTGTWTQGGVGQPLTLVLGGADAPAPPKVVVRPLDAPIDVAATTPSVVRIDDASHVVYEVHVTNVSSRELVLRRLEIVNAESQAKLTTYEGASLTERTERFGAPGAEGAAKVTLGGGQRAVVFVWLDVAEVPKALEHRITVGVQNVEGDFTVTLPKQLVSAAAPLVVGPPLQGGDWVAGNGPSSASHHRRALIPVGGRAQIAQRFAIDWVKEKAGKTYAGEANKNANYYAYGAPALAVADALVVGVKDGIAENVPGGPLPAPTLDAVAGNHVVLDLGKGLFSMYAHFQPGSLKVKVGDRVKRGQVLGLVGNSGNSTEPHLHHQISNGPSPLGSEGVPYAFDRMSTHKPKQTEWKPHPKQLPAEDDVVQFPAAPVGR